MLDDRFLQIRRRSCAEAIVDVEAVGLRADRDDVGAEFVEHLRATW